MKMTPDGPMAIPCWVNGHAYLTVTDAFHDVVDPRSGTVQHRVPLCGVDEVAEAAFAARSALAGWSTLSRPERRKHLAALAKALHDFTDHFSRLVAGETGKDEDAARAEVEHAVALFKEPAGAGRAQVLGAITDAQAPLAGLAGLIAPALDAGATVVCKPSPKAPSAAFALCELATRCGIPAGVINLVQGDEAAVDGLCANADIDGLIFSGDSALGQRIAARAAHQGKPFVHQGR